MRALGGSIAVVALAGALALGGCGGGSSETGGAAAPATSTEPPPAITPHPANARTTIVVGSKNFTEQKVLGEIYAQAFQAASYRVRKVLDLANENVALAAVRSGRISGYPEYTGTALLSFLDVPAMRLPRDSGRAYEAVRAGMAKQGIEAFPPTPFTSSNEVGLLKNEAAQLGVTKISDLRSKAPRLTLYGSPECRMRRDCLRGLQDIYGLHFKRFVAVPIGQRHAVLANGRADVSIVFSTDPQIKRNGEVLLADDKGMFPPYNSTFLMKRTTAAKAGPDLARAIRAVNANLTADVMQELNARVDIDHDTPEQAALAYLRQFNLVASG
ncbi:MAG: glycine betaine ABC transporter substrate-binding protein [Solirubrobacteraceae bacterium]